MLGDVTREQGRTILGMKRRTSELWAQQDRHPGDRWRLFSTVGDAIKAETVLYPGSYVDVAPSFVFPSVTYVEIDRRAAAFFADRDGVNKIISSHAGAPADPELAFIHGDYTDDLGLLKQAFDLLVSLCAGFVSEYCLENLSVGGHLLVNSSHGDAALASINDRLRLTGVVLTTSTGYRYSSEDLAKYLIPKVEVEVTRELILGRGRGIGYTKSPFAYLFERVS